MLDNVNSFRPDPVMMSIDKQPRLDHVALLCHSLGKGEVGDYYRSRHLRFLQHHARQTNFRCVTHQFDLASKSKE